MSLWTPEAIADSFLETVFEDYCEIVHKQELKAYEDKCKADGLI